ncbi:restriction modification system DNA specificity domain protein [Nostoc carneum NIES-2107]|nr:restriction modification system DNA specificity domain protein [Nostoc carneum NIES-2107]
MNISELPSTWIWIELDKVSEIVGGGTPSRNNLTYFGGDILWATPTDVTALDNLWIKNTKEKITQIGLKNSSAKLLPPGTVLMTSRATIGATAIAHDSMATNQGFANFICNKNLLDNEYLAYWLPSIKSHLLNLAGGTTFKEIGRSALKKIKIPLPPLPEQRQIVAILREADELRSLRQQANEKIKQFIPSLFQEMFAAKVAQRNSWKTKTIAQLGTVQYGLTVNRTRRENKNKYPYLRVANVFRGHLDLSKVVTIGITRSDLEKYLLKEGDILVVEGHANPNELGRAAVWKNEIPNCLHQNHLLRVRPDLAWITPNYLTNCINSADGINYMLRYGKTSSGLNTINSKVLSDMPIIYAPLELQKEFDRCYIEFQELVAQSQQSTKYLDSLFESLLAQAFTGNLTEIWREQHQEELVEVAAERDRLLQISQPVDVEELADEEASETKTSELHRDRNELLRSLSKSQWKIYKLVIQETAYFTPENLEEKYSIPRNIGQKNLQLLAAAGLIIPVTLPTPTSSRLQYESAYRNLNQDDDTRYSDDALLEKDAV